MHIEFYILIALLISCYRFQRFYFFLKHIIGRKIFQLIAWK